MNTDTPEDSKFRKAEQKRSRFEEMVKEANPEDRQKSLYHVQFDKMKNV